jgi:hypothetical protein
MKKYSPEIDRYAPLLYELCAFQVRSTPQTFPVLMYPAKWPHLPIARNHDSVQTAFIQQTEYVLGGLLYEALVVR